MERSIVYLDQADWAYLHAGKAPDAEDVLRTLGASGAIDFLITVHHFEEGSGLNDPASRVAFLRSFPGTAFTEWSAYDLVRYEAEKLAHGLPPELGETIGMVPLFEIADGDIEKLTFGFMKSHPVRKLLEPLYARRRDLFHLDQEALKAHGARASKADDLAIWRAQIRGQPDRAIAIWERIMRVPMTDEQRDQMRRRTEDLSTGWIAGESAGFLPPADLDFDETFVRVVFTALPFEIKRDREAIVRVLRAWGDRSRPASPLSCAAAVAAGVLDNPARGYQASDQVDVVHAAFAPIVDVFTGDRRTIDALRRLKLKARVLGTNSLSDVARYLEQAQPHDG